MAPRGGGAEKGKKIRYEGYTGEKTRGSEEWMDICSLLELRDEGNLQKVPETWKARDSQDSVEVILDEIPNMGKKEFRVSVL